MIPYLILRLITIFYIVMVSVVYALPGAWMIYRFVSEPVSSEMIFSAILVQTYLCLGYPIYFRLVFEERIKLMLLFLDRDSWRSGIEKFKNFYETLQRKFNESRKS